MSPVGVAGGRGVVSCVSFRWLPLLDPSAAELLLCSGLLSVVVLESGEMAGIYKFGEYQCGCLVVMTTINCRHHHPLLRVFVCNRRTRTGAFESAAVCGSRQKKGTESDSASKHSTRFQLHANVLN